MVGHEVELESLRMTPPKITVLMSVYNGEKFLREAIDSILIQSYPDFEFLIIDDSSTDRTPEIIRSYQDPRIKIIRNSENLGLTKSLNKGLGLAEGEYIARMDADDISYPNRLDEQIYYLNNNPDVAMVGTGRENIDEDGKILETVIPPKIVSTELLLKGNQFQHSSVMFRKEIVLKEGGYCPFMQCCQDYHLWLKLSRNYPLHNIPEVLSKLRIQRESVSVKKSEEQALSGILAIRIATNQVTDTDMEGIGLVGVSYIKNKLSKDEMNYYLYKVAGSYRIDGDFYEAQKVYWKLFLMNPLDLIAIVNFFRLFFGKKFTNETTRLWCIFINKYMSLTDRHRKI
ncbi:MAG: glycosyltransferase [Methanoregulaceae archaeon]